MKIKSFNIYNILKTDKQIIAVKKKPIKNKEAGHAEKNVIHFVLINRNTRKGIKSYIPHLKVCERVNGWLRWLKLGAFRVVPLMKLVAISELW